MTLIVFLAFKWQLCFTRLFVLLPHDAYCVAQIEIISRYIGSSLHWSPILLDKKDGTTKRQQGPYASFVIFRQPRNKRKMRLDSLIMAPVIAG